MHFEWEIKRRQNDRHWWAGGEGKWDAGGPGNGGAEQQMGKGTEGGREGTI